MKDELRKKIKNDAEKVAKLFMLCLHYEVYKRMNKRKNMSKHDK